MSKAAIKAMELLKLITKLRHTRDLAFIEDYATFFSLAWTDAADLYPWGYCSNPLTQFCPANVK